MKKIHSEIDIFTMQEANLCKLGSAFWLVRENETGLIPPLPGRELPWTDYLKPLNPAHQHGGRETPAERIEVLSTTPGETGE